MQVAPVQAGLTQQGGAPLTAHRPTLQALTGIRFFAAFYVVLFHTRVSTILLAKGHNIPGHFVSKGYFAVPIFFMLSGLILAYTYTGQIVGAGRHRRFWEARFARLWPAYALSVVLAMVVDGAHPQWLKIGATALMVQAWSPYNPGLAGAGNFVCWSLSVEAFFYLVFPFVQPWVERRSAAQLRVCLAAMLGLAVALNSGDHGPDYPALGLFAYTPLPVVHLGEFFAGVCVGNLFLRRAAVLRDQDSRGVWTYGSLLLSVAALSTADGWYTTIAVIPLCGLLYGLAWEKTALSRFLSLPLLLLGGAVSYSIYLFQLPVKEMSAKLAESLHIGSQMVRMLSVFPMLLVLAYVVFRFVEEPSRKKLRRLFAAREERVQGLV